MKKEIAMIIKILLRQQITIADLEQELYDHNKLVNTAYISCRKSNCSNRATVIHELAKIALCDRCCAEAIVETGKRVVSSSEDDNELNMAKYSFLIEDLWIDLPYASSIRNVQNRIENRSEIIH